jgi:hypothetical protein
MVSDNNNNSRKLPLILRGSVGKCRAHEMDLRQNRSRSASCPYMVLGKHELFLLVNPVKSQT